MNQTIEILVGTTAGNTEFLAAELELQLQQQGLTTNFHDAPAWHEVSTKHPWLLCISTHGAGEYAESIAQFMDDLATKRPDLTKLRYALVSIGDSSYDTFCQAGQDANSLLQELGAQPVAELLTIDMMLNLTPEDTAKDWLTRINW